MYKNYCSVNKQPVNTIIFLLLVLVGCNNSNHKQQNRLQYASSPYLQEHADNPVDWYEWGDEALAKAKKENKPLLISIGYASCHWCHEMEKESFIDTAVARVMNENFICIKVDREERPDIDNIYMNALQLLSGEGGWPLNAFALPDGKPFFAGTYYDKKSWLNLLSGVATAYKTKYNLVQTQANALINGIASEELSLIDTSLSTTKPSPTVYQTLYDSIYKRADLVNGGIQGSPKFPVPAFTEFLLQHYYTTGNKDALKAATTTLKKMALGGIYDHVAGGFARYATDSLWRVPHFEKMLYDNGQLASVYAHAYQVTKDPFFKNVLIETLNFVDKTLAAPGGGYYSSVNADTEAGEGEYYAWNKKDFVRATGGEGLLAGYYHVSDAGNWKPGNNILYANQTPEEFAIEKKISPVEFAAKLTTAKTNLYNERNKRIKPVVDTKIITAWDAIMLKGYADAYAATGTEDYLLKARSLAAFIEKNMLAKDGSLKRNFKDGKALITAFLDDYALTATALARLYEVSFDSHWMLLSKQLVDYAVHNFYNEQNGLFFYSEKQTGLVLRKTEISDDAIPSSNAVMAGLLYKTGTVFNDSAYCNKAVKMYYAVAESIKKMPRYYMQWCSFAAMLSSKSYEVVIMGKDAIAKNKELQQYYLPTSIIMGSIGDESFPLMENKSVPGKTLVYVCTNKSCKRPEEEIPTALLQMKQQ